ncbi:MAG: penicillin acylase family protein, partial [Gemmatimonadota bacterium]
DGACLLLWLAGLTITWFWFDLWRSTSEPSGTVELGGLSAPVRVYSDSFGIPHVFAAGETDALRALGYLHATDRMWQMEMFRRIAEGRLSEIFGERGLATDRFVRTLGTAQAAERAAASLAPEERRRIEAYASGVNAYLYNRPALAPEFRVLRLDPEPWDVESTLAVGMVMNLDLAVWRSELSRFWASRHLDPERFALLDEGYPAWGPTILTSEWSPPAGVTPASAPGRAEAPSSFIAAAAEGMPAVPGGRETGRPPAAGEWSPFDVLGTVSARSGSNSWVISGDRTASGHPILANDMHLALRAPSLWYLAALHGANDRFSVAGFTLPGVPGVVVGHNRNVAWGFTNGMVDDVDFVVESLSEDGLRYRDRVDGEWVWIEIETRTDTVPVRGRTPELVRVRSTRRGPLLSDVLDGIGADLSVQWVAADATVSSIGLHGLNRADGAEALDEAVRQFGRPHQNVVYAGRDGTIGYRLGGRIPLREGRDGAIPVPADSASAVWDGFWPTDAHPAERNPRRGYIATANNLQARGLGRSISSDYAAPLRALRITQALEVRRDWSVEATYALQHDTRSLLADRTLERAVRAARRLGLDAEAARLESWDRHVRIESQAAPLFYSWFYRLRALVAADEFGAAPEWAFFPLEAILRTLEEGDGNAWIDDVSTPEVESLEQLEDRALKDALRVTAGATWGELHQERHTHPLGSVSWLNRLLGLDIGPYPSGGGPNTLRPDDYRVWAALDAGSWTPPWLSEYGPSERFVAEVLPDRIAGRFLIPTGQSGNPLSDHYRDMNPRWRAGDLIDVPLDEESARARSVNTYTFVP